MDVMGDCGDVVNALTDHESWIAYSTGTVGFAAHRRKMDMRTRRLARPHGTASVADGETVGTVSRRYILGMGELWT